LWGEFRGTFPDFNRIVNAQSDSRNFPWKMSEVQSATVVAIPASWSQRVKRLSLPYLILCGLVIPVKCHRERKKESTL
jgi:hypothetical protein